VTLRGLLMGLLLAGSSGLACASDPIYGVIASLPAHTNLLVDVKEAADVRWIKRQVKVQLRGIAAHSRTGRPAEDRMVLNRLLLGQKVELLDCDVRATPWRCNAQVSRDRQPDLRFDVADLLVANGLAKHTR
jgi:hypothetical protein